MTILSGVGVFVLLFVILFVGIVAYRGGFSERAVGASYLAFVAAFSFAISAVVAIAVTLLMHKRAG